MRGKEKNIMTTIDTTTQHAVKPQNVIEAYRSYIKELTDERDAIKARMATDAARLKEINAELDGEKEEVNTVKSMLTQTRKRRENKAPTQIVDGQPVQKKRGRKSNAEKAAEAAAQQ
jgi:hypothetical protein